MGLEPQWVEPSPPDLRALDARISHAQAEHRKRVTIVICIFVFSFVLGPLFLLGWITGIVLAINWFVKGYRQDLNERAALMLSYQSFRQEQWLAYREHHSTWQAEASAWDQAEERRRASLDTWFPIVLRPSIERVDIVGGTPAGWAAQLCVTGCSILGSGKPLWVVDLTDESVSTSLVALARCKVRRIALSSGPGQGLLLTGLDAKSLAEAIAEAVDTVRKGGSDVERRLMDAELLSSVATILGSRVTIPRLAAGLAVLQRTYEPVGVGELSADEVHRLTQMLDTIAETEMARSEARFLRALLSEVADAEDEDIRGSCETSLESPALCDLHVMRSLAGGPRRKDLADRILLQALVQRIRRGEYSDSETVIVLVGCDHLGREALQSVSRACRQAGLRLVLMLRRIDADLEPVIGEAESASLFMRLAGAKEAAMAADHIGRNHSFKMTQINRQTGLTDTSGISVSVGASTTFTTGESRARQGTTHSSSESVGVSEQGSVNESQATSVTDGITVTRVYELSVEPAAIQSLEALSSILVESVGGVRTAISATCDPAMALMPRVSPRPYSP
jgi:hypothetical protein